MTLLNKLKYIGTFVLIALLLIVLSPIILITGISVFGYWLWCQLFMALRHDPHVKFTQIIKLADSGTEEELFKNTQIYFDDLVNEIAKLSGTKATAMTKELTQFEDTEKLQVITFAKQVTNEEVKLDFNLSLTREEMDEGIFYSATNNGDDADLAGEIDVRIRLKDRQDDEFNLAIGYDQLGAYFCVGLLRGRGRFSPMGGQLWSFIEEKNVWVVKYGPESTSALGLRNSYSKDRARRLWFDVWISE